MNFFRALNNSTVPTQWCAVSVEDNCYTLVIKLENTLKTRVILQYSQNCWTWRSNRRSWSYKNWIMASVRSNFLYEVQRWLWSYYDNYLNLIFIIYKIINIIHIITSNMFQNDEKSNLEINSCIKNMHQRTNQASNVNLWYKLQKNITSYKTGNYNNTDFNDFKCKFFESLTNKGVLWELVLLWFLPAFPKHRQGWQRSKSLIPYRSGSESWYFPRSSL